MAAAQDRRSALLVAPTGAGKTLAGFLPTLVELAEGSGKGGLHTLYISPLKALRGRHRPQPRGAGRGIGLEQRIRIETRTGDTPSHKRTGRSRARPTSCSHPEQLALLIAHREAAELFRGLKRVVLDELHASSPRSAATS